MGQLLAVRELRVTLDARTWGLLPPGTLWPVWPPQDQLHLCTPSPGTSGQRLPTSTPFPPGLRTLLPAHPSLHSVGPLSLASLILSGVAHSLAGLHALTCALP